LDFGVDFGVACEESRLLWDFPLPWVETGVPFTEGVVGKRVDDDDEEGRDTEERRGGPGAVVPLSLDVIGVVGPPEVNDEKEENSDE